MKSFLQHYNISPYFEVTGRELITCSRYDELFARGEVPAPDVIKIDVQGFEHQVLSGFGHLLDSCVSIELETHFYQLYRDQRLFGDIISLLADFDFVLRKVSPVPNFDGDIVEADVQFTKRRSEIKTYDDVKRRKFDLTCKTFDVWNYA
jgi:Methyltransferase FkbM domain